MSEADRWSFLEAKAMCMTVNRFFKAFKLSFKHIVPLKLSPFHKSILVYVNMTISLATNVHE